MVSSTSFLAGIVLFVGSCGENIIRMPISRILTTGKPAELLMVTPLKVDGQDMYAQVDTGSSHTQLVWRTWYESVSPKGCGDLFYKCYHCVSTECLKGPTTSIHYVDGSTLTVFPHFGDFYFDGATAIAMKFGLVTGASRGPWAAIGLGSRSVKPPYKRFVDQLRSQHLIDSGVFSLYLSSGRAPSGELIIGGDDPSKYVGHLEYFGITDKGRQKNTLRSFNIGGKVHREVQPVLFDTGTSVINFPERLRAEVVSLLQTTGTSEVDIVKVGNIYIVDCDDKDHLPTMRFIMQGLVGKYDVTISVPSAAYVIEILPGTCHVGIDFGGDWIMGLPAFVGNYYSVDYVGAKIGVAKEDTAKCDTIRNFTIESYSSSLQVSIVRSWEIRAFIIDII
ncbi:hypothetical protein FOZ60_014265 [Perkinsus olseni]|uniref:Peptidase A1 domain-containing protein n=1 Tax=Perkinsus olseni TaxID=32597 RepID=A0A7J6N7T3_PEROL|nr:hypothetical protein FOZ60_014265 [Perkinsus olseni]